MAFTGQLGTSQSQPGNIEIGLGAGFVPWFSLARKELPGYQVPAVRPPVLVGYPAGLYPSASPTLVPLVHWSPQADPRVRRHEQLVSAILNSLLLKLRVLQQSAQEFDLGYTPADGSNWGNPPPTTLWEALDQIALALTNAGARPGGVPYQDVDAAGGSGTPANPTAQIGLSAAVNGTASTYMRSDAAPPLSAVARLQLRRGALHL